MNMGLGQFIIGMTAVISPFAVGGLIVRWALDYKLKVEKIRHGYPLHEESPGRGGAEYPEGGGELSERLQ
jgi:hypothetical protein